MVRISNGVDKESEKKVNENHRIDLGGEGL